MSFYVSCWLQVSNLFRHRDAPEHAPAIAPLCLRYLAPAPGSGGHFCHLKNTRQPRTPAHPTRVAKEGSKRQRARAEAAERPRAAAAAAPPSHPLAGAGASARGAANGWPGGLPPPLRRAAPTPLVAGAAPGARARSRAAMWVSNTVRCRFLVVACYYRTLPGMLSSPHTFQITSSTGRRAPRRPHTPELVSVGKGMSVPHSTEMNVGVITKY